jgi:hypothetical protein
MVNAIARMNRTCLFLVLVLAMAQSTMHAIRTLGTASDPVTPPTVLSTTPFNGAMLECPNSMVVSATFSKPMNPATINNTTFTLTGPGGASVAGAVTYSAAGNIATFNAMGTLLPTTTFTATITTGAADTFGNAMTVKSMWTFTTSPRCPPPSAAPTVLQVTPRNNSTPACARSKVIAATFSQEMNPDSINTTTFRVTGQGEVSIVGAVTYDVATHVATFLPSTSFAPNTTITATITQRVADSQGNALTADYVWTFTTPPSCASTIK